MLPSVPVMGEVVTDSHSRLSSWVTKFWILSTAFWWRAGSRTMPPLPMSSRWSSN